MSDLKNAAAGAVVVTEGEVASVGTQDRKRAGRKVRVVNVKALQDAVNRAEANGPLPSLTALYTTIAADEIYNHDNYGVGPITKRIKAGLEAGLTIQTKEGRKGREANPDKPANDGITDERADEMRVSYAHFANPESLELMIAAARKGSKRTLRFFATLERLLNPPEPEVETEVSAEAVTA